MTLDLAFWAYDDAHARSQAEAWIAAESNVASGTVTKVVFRETPVPGHTSWAVVTVELVFREAAVPNQVSLWDAA